MAAIRDNVRPPAGHAQHIEKVGGVLNWKSFFAPLKLDVHGHTRTHRMRQAGVDAIHCFRFVRRENCGRPGGWPWPPTTCPEDPLDHPCDVWLLGMMHMSGTALAENLLFCRHSSFECLAKSAPDALPLLKLDGGMAKEFEKTAKAVEQEPWRLHRAAAYIRQLIAEPPAPAPPSTSWLWHWAGRPGGLEWPTTVVAENLCGIGEDKTPGELAIEDGRAPRTKRKRTTARRPPEGEVAPAEPVADVAAPAVPPPTARVDAPASAEDAPASAEDAPASAEPPPPPARRRTRTTTPLCPGLGCAKCRRSQLGCRVCKAKLGWFETALGQWEHHG